MNSTFEADLRQRLAAFADTVEPADVDLAGARQTARRLDRRRNRLVAAGSAAALAVVAAGAVGSGVIACWIPARTISRLDPIVILRED